ncbi:permease-like cell division protein FtsX [Bacillus tianshenii]|nr:permease-like cell division protein FtsX [Bacillus tianshenii]
MKIRTLFRHFREGMKNITRNGWMTFASVSAVTVTLVLVGTFLIIMMNLNEMANTIEKDVEIRVHIDLTASEQQQEALQQKIEQIPQVKDVQYVSKEQELNSIISSLGDEGKAFESLKEENPLNDVLVVQTNNPQLDTKKVAKKIDKYQFATKVNYGQETVERLFKVLTVARNIGIGLIIGLMFTAMFLISNTIKITIVARRREIEIMKLVGATNWFIRWPFFVEGLMLGILGSIIPITLLLTSYDYVYKLLNPKLQESFLHLLPFNPYAFQLAGILLGIGALIGVWGSLMSVRKFLRV